MTNLDQRYGRKPTNKKAVAALGATLFVLFMVWAIWVNFAPHDRVSAQLGFVTMQSENEITAHVTVSQPGTVCSFKAMSEGYAIVGYKSVSTSETEYDLRIKTTTKAIDVLVDACRVK